MRLTSELNGVGSDAPRSTMNNHRLTAFELSFLEQRLPGCDCCDWDRSRFTTVLVLTSGLSIFVIGGHN
jgi:hypothetical protein